MSDNFDSRFKSTRRRLNDRRDKFDRDFERSERLVMVIWVLAAVVGLAALTGIGFVIYRVMLHFGIM